MTPEQAVWASIDSPALRHQLVELIASASLVELADGWGFESVDDAKQYVYGPLMCRIRREGGRRAVEFLELRCAERGI